MAFLGLRSRALSFDMNLMVDANVIQMARRAAPSVTPVLATCDSNRPARSAVLPPSSAGQLIASDGVRLTSEIGYVYMERAIFVYCVAGQSCWITLPAAFTLAYSAPWPSHHMISFPGDVQRYVIARKVGQTP